MLNLGFKPQKVLQYSKSSLLPFLVMGLSLVYFCSVTDFSEEKYHSMHAFFILMGIAAFFSSILGRIISLGLSAIVIITSYIIINNMRYAYGEDYIFSSGYNIWSILLLPNLLLIYFIFTRKKSAKYWSWFCVFLFLETALIEKMQNQTLDADSYYFYHHIGMLNYPAFYISILCLLILIVHQIVKGRILGAAFLFMSLSASLALFFSDNLFAFSFFFAVAALLNFACGIYYTHYKLYKDEELDIANTRYFLKETEKKYPLKYSIALMYIDEYERLLKRFGAKKMRMLKKMFLVRILKIQPKVKIYNYKTDSLILAFKNTNAPDAYEKAESIRRVLAKSIFVFNESNHLQLTVSQCISEKKRSDADAMAVLARAEESLQKACRFTRNITIKA